MAPKSGMEEEKGEEEEERYDDKLPEELKEEIFVRVGVSNLFKLRLVCRSWRKLLQSRTFARAHACAAIADPLLLAVHARSRSRTPALYCLSTSIVLRQPPLPFLPSRVKEGGGSGARVACDFSTSVGDGGLLCCLARSLAHPWGRRPPPSLLVFNPLTAKSRLLPPPPIAIAEREWRDPKLCIGIVRNPLTNMYKVALLGAGNNIHVNNIVQVYDSEMDSWTIGRSPLVQSLDRKQKFNGYIGHTKDKVYWYNIEIDQWEEAPLPYIDDELEFHSISVVKKKNKHIQNQDGKGKAKRPMIMLVATLALCHGPKYNTQGFALWEEVDGSQRYWKEVTRTPTKFLNCTDGGYLRRGLHRLANSHIITHPFAMCMTSITRRYQLASLWDCFYPWLLIYNPSTISWDWLPRPLGNKTWSNYDVACILEPNFEAMV